MVECSFTYYVVLASNLVAVNYISHITPATSKEFLDIPANYKLWIHSETRM